jgi:hypothetical protein
MRGRRQLDICGELPSKPTEMIKYEPGAMASANAATDRLAMSVGTKCSTHPKTTQAGSDRSRPAPRISPSPSRSVRRSRCPRGEGAAAGAVRLGVHPRHPRHHPAAAHRRRPRLGRARLAPGHAPGRHRDRAAGAGRLRRGPGGQAGGRVGPAAQAVGVRHRPRPRRRARAPRLEPGRPDPVDRPRRRRRGPAGRRQPRPGRDAAGRGRAAGAAGSAPDGVLRRPLLRGAAPAGGGHAPPGRPAPAQGRAGTDRPCRLGIAGRAGLDRRGHRPPGARPEAPRRQRDPAPSPSPRCWPRCSAPTSSGSAPPWTGGSSRPPGAASCRIRAATRPGTRPAGKRSPPPSTGHRSAAAPRTCGTRRCRCG